MALVVGVPRERASGERRVALDPEAVRRLVRDEIRIVVEAGAGAGAAHSDAAYEAAGARIGTADEAFGAPVVLKVAPPDDDEIARLGEGSVLIGFLSPLDRPEVAERLAARGVTALSMELVPRISRAQKMDALSAMSAVAGYRAVLLAATTLPKFFPLLTTAAGTLRPASVLVLGAGVAGLQAIATARRLGARASAYDIREAAREEVQSLGGTFVELQVEMQADPASGGYARALGEEKARRQTELLVPFIEGADVVVSTALIPGRPAPLLVTEGAVERMTAGSVIVDLAAPNGGNCALTRPGETVTAHGVTILGPLNLPSEMPVHASQMYARTVSAMLLSFVRDGRFVPDFDDDVFTGACVAHGGEVTNERVRGLLVS